MKHRFRIVLKADFVVLGLGLKIMRISSFIPFLTLFILLNLEFLEAKKRLKIGKKVKKLFVNSGKKAKKIFVKHKHHNHKASSTSISTFIQPTATTFTSSFTLSELLMTITDRDYNYFYGYPTNIPGFGGNNVNLYRSSRYLIAKKRQNCGCCDNKIIIVTKAPEEKLI